MPEAWRRRRAPAALLAGLLLACGGGGGSSTHEVRGVIRDVQHEYRQLIVEHEAIPNLMAAMTMNFDVADAIDLGALEAGQVIEFTLEVTPRSYTITRIEVVGREAAEGASSGGGLDAPGTGRAPDFALTDQDGRDLALADLRGKCVLIDFVFTTCDGPCPIVTARHVRLQRALDTELRPRTHFVSISLDPERDTPDALRAYASARGADLSNWSFLTGPPEQVAAVVERYGVGSKREPGGEIEHIVAAFLVDPQGRIAERYLGLDHDPESMLRDLRRLR
ncbi:MAG: SCO family protein [Deltaproteobacteria bacterium]|nr:MAG: SCO family protein [Deltaproteobacteria bacterium]